MTQLVTPQCMIENKNTVFSLLRSSDQKKWQTGSCCATRRKYLRGLEAPSNKWRSPRHNFPIKAKKGFSSLQLDLMDKIFTRSPKNGLSQTLQLFPPAPGDASLDFRCSPPLFSDHTRVISWKSVHQATLRLCQSTRRRIPTHGQQGGVAGSSALRQLKTQRWPPGGATTCATRANYGALNVAVGATSVEQRFLQRRSRMATLTLICIKEIVNRVLITQDDCTG